MTPMAPESDDAQMFESAPISLWLEDYSALRTLFDHWRAQGVTDLAAHLAQAPGRLTQCAASLKVIKVNRKTLQVFGAASQDELMARLPEVFRDDMLGQMLPELVALWDGDTAFSNQTCNYGLDGRRIDVQIHVQLLQGHEDSWGRVLVSLEDITQSVKARQQLAAANTMRATCSTISPVSLWVEDFSGVKRLLDDVRERGISDFRVFISVHPEFVTRCMEEIRVISVNQQTLTMFARQRAARAAGPARARCSATRCRPHFAEQLIDLWNGKIVQSREVINYSLSGDLINIHMQFAVLPGHEAEWDLVLVSLIDITARKKAEAYLEYLGKHDSLTTAAQPRVLRRRAQPHHAQGALAAEHSGDGPQRTQARQRRSRACGRRRAAAPAGEVLATAAADKTVLRCAHRWRRIRRAAARRR